MVCAYRAGRVRGLGVDRLMGWSEICTRALMMEWSRVLWKAEGRCDDSEPVLTRLGARRSKGAGGGHASLSPFLDVDPSGLEGLAEGGG